MHLRFLTIRLCRDHLNAKIDQISASGPITQAWETLHSMEAFKYFSLVKHYSLLFRLKENLEMERMLFANRGVPVPGADTMAGVIQRLRGLENGVCHELIELEPQLQSALNEAVSKLVKREKDMFDAAFEKHPVRAK